MKVGLSPCPNDTFLFHPWICHRIATDIPIEPFFADIDQLNQWALKKYLPVTKISFSCFAKLLPEYELLPVGAALGWRCGPKIISSHYFEPHQLAQKKVAVPGLETTAYLLLSRLLPPPREIIVVPYHEIGKKICEGKVDCGLIIHETRFTYANEGFVEIADLGELWHQQTKAPLPLGGMAIARSLPRETKLAIGDALKSSLAYAQSKREEAIDFILAHSQEKEADVVWKHIETYVTAETASLSSEGIRAIQTLLGCGAQEEWLFG